jgi:ATP adenylyltransferase
MDHLWTPWRYQYIETARCPSGCVFCEVQNSQEDSSQFILRRGLGCFVILNLYPYTNGHLMVVSNRHIADLHSAFPDELQEFILAAQCAQRALSCVYHPEGFNLGMNLGVCAGAGVDGHLHLHVLPRWKGDTNFMTVTSETRVLPETLPQTYAKLLPYFNSSPASK